MKRTRTKVTRKNIAPVLAPEPAPDILTPREAAKVLRVSPGTLAIWRCLKRYGLPFSKVGSKVVYRRSDLDAFIQAGRVG